MLTSLKAPSTTAGLRQKALADEMKTSLVRYHQLDGEKNGSHMDGVQFTPVADPTEPALRQHIEEVTTFLSQQPDVQYRPSPAKNPEREEFRTELAAKAAPYVKGSAKQMLAAATDMIGDPALKALVQLALKTCPEEFYTAPSSSSGRYHPADEINDGGLVLHTARVVATAQHLADFYQVSPKEKDILTAALIVHDSCKGGKPWKKYAPDHGDVAAAHVKSLKGGNTKDGKVVQRLAANHMAQWTKTANNKSTPRPPADKLEQIVSYADYLASQDNVYVVPPGFSAEYLK